MNSVVLFVFTVYAGRSTAHVGHAVQTTTAATTTTLPAFCGERQCPEYRGVTGTNYEEREYGVTKWVSTEHSGSTTTTTTYLSMFMKLYLYLIAQKIDLAVPVITKVYVGNRTYAEMSIYMPPNAVVQSASTDNTLFLQMRPRFTVYVTNFTSRGSPSREMYDNNHIALIDVLDKAGKTFRRDYYFTAGYSDFMKEIKYNELWVPKL